jgi:hypothetical protein
MGRFEMVKDKNVSSIADDTKPNPGRIYDYLLGGNHNFEVDRAQAAMILEVLPEIPKVLRLVRWFLGEAVRLLLEDGYTQFVDFASGLPVQDHIHQIAPPGTKVVYSDIDPITVIYALEIMGDNPDVRYLTCDIRNPEEVLQSDHVATLFDKEKKTAIGVNGITPYIDAESLRHTFKVLYNWARKGDRLYVCDWLYSDSQPGSYESINELQRIYKEMGVTTHIHSFEQMHQLIGHWKPVSPGYQLLEKWVGISGTQMSFEKELKEIAGSEIYGAILEKQ